MSKNNPAKRGSLRLEVLCPDTNQPMKIVKKIPGNQMFYKSEGTGKYYKISKQSYKNFEYRWVKK